MLENGATFSGAVARALESLRTHIANKVAFHLLLAAARRHPLTSAEFGQVVLLVEAFVFRRFVVEGQSLGRFTAEVTEAARWYAANTQSPQALADYLRKLSTDENFVAFLAAWSVGTGKQGFYALEMIENYRSAGAGLQLARQSASQHLEHIMPKRPGVGWEHVAAAPEFARSAEYDMHLQRLGNLLVLEADINIVVSNKAFADKYANTPKNYQDSKLRLPAEVADHLESGAWTFQSIEARQRALSEKWAVLVWSLAVPGGQ